MLFDDAGSKVIEAAIRRISLGVAMAYGCEVEVEYDQVFGILINDLDETQYRLSAAKVVFGESVINGNAAPVGASENFARALRIAPRAFANIEKVDSAPLHTSAYDFNDDALVHYVRRFVELVRQRLPA